MSTWLQIKLQDAVSPTINILIIFHDLILITIILIITIIIYITIFIITNKLTNRTLKEAHKIELIWTIIPSIILLILAVPSLNLLYIIDESIKPGLTVKSIGHQWYWRYEYNDLPTIKFDSFIKQTDLLLKGEYRLLEVDNRIILPIQTEIRLLVTSSDVIHAWTVPSIGIKVDAIPGRLNQLRFTLIKGGVFYGQCSEICGANHSFIPIVIESINIASFIKWFKIAK